MGGVQPPVQGPLIKHGGDCGKAAGQVFSEGIFGEVTGQWVCEHESSSRGSKKLRMMGQ